MFRFNTKNINNKIDNKSAKKYQHVIDQLTKKINIRVLEGSDMMG
jgi:hypothetical protein